MSEREGTVPQPIRCAAWCDQWPHCQHDWSAWGAARREGTVPAPSDRESDTRCDTAAPSDEAVEVAILTAAYPDHDDGHTDTYYAGILTAAYAVDWPRREAEVRAEERAATLREVIAWLRAAGPAAGGSQEVRERIADFIVDRFAGGRVVTLPEVLAWLRAPEDDIVVESRRITVAAEIAAHFNPEAE